MGPETNPLLVKGNWRQAIPQIAGPMPWKVLKVVTLNCTQKPKDKQCNSQSSRIPQVKHDTQSLHLLYFGPAVISMGSWQPYVNCITIQSCNDWSMGDYLKGLLVQEKVQLLQQMHLLATAATSLLSRSWESKWTSNLYTNLTHLGWAVA